MCAQLSLIFCEMLVDAIYPLRLKSKRYGHVSVLLNMGRKTIIMGVEEDYKW